MNCVQQIIKIYIKKENENKINFKKQNSNAQNL